jgi:HD-like signal output (HDOD) protein
MDGTELMNRIRQTWPDTVRLVLSGEVDRVKILSSFGPAHKFFAKPTDPTELFAAALHALDLKRQVTHPGVTQMLMGIDALPYPNKYYLDLIDLLRSEQANADSVAALIGRNNAMSTTALRMANATIFAVSGKVTTVRRAVQVLGFDQLERLALVVGLYQSGEHHGIDPIDLASISAQALFVGQMAGQIVHLEGGSAEQRDLALTGGMLCAIGKLVLLRHSPDALRDATRLSEADQLSVPEAERQLFGTTHPELGAHLLGLWGFPTDLSDCVLHHQSGITTPGMSTAARAVAAAHTLQTLSAQMPPH